MPVLHQRRVWDQDHDSPLLTTKTTTTKSNFTTWEALPPTKAQKRLRRMTRMRTTDLAVSSMGGVKTNQVLAQEEDLWETTPVWTQASVPP